MNNDYGQQFFFFISPRNISKIISHTDVFFCLPIMVKTEWLSSSTVSANVFLSCFEIFRVFQVSPSACPKYSTLPIPLIICLLICPVKTGAFLKVWFESDSSRQVKLYGPPSI